VKSTRNLIIAILVIAALLFAGTDIALRPKHLDKAEPPKHMEIIFLQNNRLIVEELEVGPKFTFKQRVRATNAFVLVKYLLRDTSLYPDFTRFYWATNMETCDGITTQNSPRSPKFSLIDHAIYPDSEDYEEMFHFGKVLVHETAHLSHDLAEREVNLLIDVPAEKSFEELKRKFEFLKNPLIKTNAP